MAKDDLVYVSHMFDMAEKALKLANGKTRAAFDSDETLALALTHLVQIIGEAARSLTAGRDSNGGQASARLQPAAGLEPGSSHAPLGRGPIEIGPQAEACPPRNVANIFMRS